MITNVMQSIKTFHMIEYMVPYDDMKDVNTQLVKSEKTASETLKSRREVFLRVTG